MAATGGPDSADGHESRSPAVTATDPTALACGMTFKVQVRLSPEIAPPPRRRGLSQTRRGGGVTSRTRRSEFESEHRVSVAVPATGQSP